MKSALRCNINAVTVPGTVSVVEHNGHPYWVHQCHEMAPPFACHTIALLRTCSHMTGCRHMTGWQLKTDFWCAAELEAAHRLRYLSGTHLTTAG